MKLRFPAGLSKRGKTNRDNTKRKETKRIQKKTKKTIFTFYAYNKNVFLQNE